MSISGIEGIGAGFTPFVAPTVAPTDAPGTTGVSSIAPGDGPGGAFGAMLMDGIERLESVQNRADGLAVKAATGDLSAIHDYTMAATEASVTTQMTVAVRNKAVEAFSEIMRMQV